MIRRLTIAAALAVLAARPAAGQTAVNLNDLFEAGRAWVRTNAAPALAQQLAQVDAAQVEAVWQEVQTRFQGEYVVDLAPLQQAAIWAARVLELQESTRPYGLWLGTRLDYFDVAEKLRVTIPPPDLAVPYLPELPPPLATPPAALPPRPDLTPPPLLTNAPLSALRRKPSPAWQRLVWRAALRQRASPTGADGYATRLKSEFRKRGIPEELVWLAEVESSFNPDARSPAGATGLFQIMPETARGLGLSLWPADERRHPEKSAAAAARYLKYLYSRFGSWPLALAAYNAGEGTVSKALDRHRGGGFDDIAGHLPAETQLYVPKVDATLQRREGKTLEGLPGPG